MLTLSLVLFVALSTPTASAYHDFDDVPASHPFYTYVNAVAEAGFMPGLTDEHFGVDEQLPRWSAAVIVEHAAFGVFDSPECTGLVFRDIGPGYPVAPLAPSFCGYVEDFARREITHGCGDGFYCPDAGTTRAQLAVFIVRALGEFNPSPDIGPTFLDVSSSHYAYAFIRNFGARHITLGCGEGNFCPERVATRGEMAVFVARAFLGFK